MEKMFRIYMMIFLLVATVLGYQNCSRVSFEGSFSSRAKSGRASMVSGNGQGYDHKLIGEFRREIPGFSCEGQPSPHSTIGISSSQITLTQNTEDQCASATNSLAEEDLMVSPYFKDIIGYGEGAYRRNRSNTEILRGANHTLETWCRWPRSESEGMDIVVTRRMDTDQRMASVIIGENGIRKDVSPFKVLQDLNSMQGLTYLSAVYDFHLQVDFQSGEKLNSGLFIGKLSSQIDGKNIEAQVICYTAGSLDRKAFDLKFLGASDPSSHPRERTFDENQSPAWKLQGACDPEAGPVKIYGQGVSTETVTSCLQSGSDGGRFEIDIHYSSREGEPYFTDSSGLHREVLARQSSFSPSQTWVFKSNSRWTVEYISTAVELQAIQTGIGRPVYILVNDIDLAQEVGPNNNWSPIGPNFSNPFSSVFEGNNKVISNLNAVGGDYVGLFGYALNATIQNITLQRLNISSTGDYVGGITGHLRFSSLKNVHVSGRIQSAGDYVGGLAGYIWDGQVLHSSSNSSISGRSFVGGIAGALRGDLIANSHSMGSITSSGQAAGGLVGLWFDHNSGNKIANSFAKKRIEGENSLGGLVGLAQLGGGFGGELRNSYSNSLLSCLSTTPCGDAVIGQLQSSAFVIQGIHFVEGKCDGCVQDLGVGMSSAELINPSYFLGWDFLTPVWSIHPIYKAPY